MNGCEKTNSGCAWRIHLFDVEHVCLCRYLADDFAVRTTRPTYHLFILPVASLIERLARREQNRHDASVLFLLWIFVNFQVQLSSNYRSAILIHVGVPFIEASNSNPLSFVSPSLGNSPSNSAMPFSKGWKITAWMLRTDRWTDDRFISRSSDRFICDVPLAVDSRNFCSNYRGDYAATIFE